MGGTMETNSQSISSTPPCQQWVLHCCTVEGFPANSTSVCHDDEGKRRRFSSGKNASVPLTIQAVVWGLQPSFSTTITLAGAAVGVEPHLRPLSLSFPHPTSPIHSNMPTCRCSDAWIFPMCLCVDLGILCWVIIVLLVVNLMGEIKTSSHSALMLMSPVFIVQLKRMNTVVCKLYLNNAVENKYWEYLKMTKMNLTYINIIYKHSK